MRLRASRALLVCVLATVAAGCGSAHKDTATTSHAAADPLLPLRQCVERQGYSVTPDTPAALRTAPGRFRFVAVWNLLNPNNRVALALAISRTNEGARLAAAWTRKTNARLGKGVVKAPVVQFGRIDVLWTAEPARPDTASIYGCVRRAL